jgi:hypothetical protein
MKKTGSHRGVRIHCKKHSTSLTTISRTEKSTGSATSTGNGRKVRRKHRGNPSRCRVHAGRHRRPGWTSSHLTPSGFHAQNVKNSSVTKTLIIEKPLV